MVRSSASSLLRMSTPTICWPPRPCPRASVPTPRPRRRRSQPAPRRRSISSAFAAAALDLIGLLAVEMFVTKDGGLLCNEMAPRPHNSGHWTMDACGTDQFEQLVRAAAELPLRDPARHADVTMVNLVGAAVNDLDAYLADPNAHIHLYGKREARP